MESKMTTAMFASVITLATAFGCGSGGGNAGGAIGGGGNLGGLLIASDAEITGSAGNVYVIKADDTGRCDLTNSNNVNNTLAVSSFDGSKVTYTSNQSGTYNIWTVEANGGNQKQLTSSGAVISAFSPDGTSIVYSGHQTGQREVWVMYSDGTSQKQLTTTTVNAITRSGVDFINSTVASYSPDGKKIVYASTQNGRSEIWVMNADGTNQTQLTFTTNPNFPDANLPAWCPEGTKIAFWSGFESELGQIWVMNSEGTGRTQLTFETGVNSNLPNWSPDGKTLMFVSNRVSSTVQTWTMNADGSNPQVLLTSRYGSGRNPWHDDPVQADGSTFLSGH